MVSMFHQRGAITLPPCKTTTFSGTRNSYKIFVRDPAYLNMTENLTFKTELREAGCESVDLI